MTLPSTDYLGSLGGPRLLRIAGIAAALAAGLAIAYVDSRPGWDSTGLTAGALMLVAFVAAFGSGRRPWLWALLVGAATPLVEIPASGSAASLAALLFAALGAAAGFGLAEVVRQRS